MGSTHPRLQPLLQAVHAVHLFADSKEIVDRPLRAPAEQVAAAFTELRLPDHAHSLPAHRAALIAFLDRWFDPVESDLVRQPYGEVPPPPAAWLPLVTHPPARRWARHLHATWASLARGAAPCTQHHPELHSLLWVPRPFVPPGARFREAYYWDSYFVQAGLLASGLPHMAADLVDNLLHLVQLHGFAPNGLRTYYLNRSQPPLLSAMVRVQCWALGGEGAAALMRRALPALLQEHAHWTAAPKQVTVVGADGAQYHMSRYYAAWDKPRPESYREDVETAAAAGAARPGESGSTAAAQGELYRNLASAAESGWDFSSRWLEDGGGLHTARTTAIIPADLSAFLFQMERHIAAYAMELGEASLAERFSALADARLHAITQLHWDAVAGQWRDLLLKPLGAESEAGATAELECSCSHNPGTFASNWVPLWCGCAGEGSAQATAAVAALAASGLVQPGGIAASLAATGQQWDWPNAWPPLQLMLIHGCRQYGGAAGEALAAEVAGRYLRTAHAAWAATGRMFEKFDAGVVGMAGGGGEYECVDGFGWTNGVALQLLEWYGWWGEGGEEQGGGGKEQAFPLGSADS